MNSQAGWYWIAVGVFALGLSNGLSQRDLDRVQCAVDRTVGAAQQISDQIVDRVQLAALTFSDGGASLEDQTNLAVAHAQRQLACLRAQEARSQAAMVRVEAAKIRVLKFEDKSISTVKCPNGKIEVHIRRASTDGDTI